MSAPATPSTTTGTTTEPCPKGDPDCETGDDGSCHDACEPLSVAAATYARQMRSTRKPGCRYCGAASSLADAVTVLFAKLAGADSTGSPVIPLSDPVDVLSEIEQHVTDLAARLQASERAREALEARPESEWHEDFGSVLWWLVPVCQPPYSGQPQDSDWPFDDEDTHRLWWTPVEGIARAVNAHAAPHPEDRTDG